MTTNWHDIDTDALEQAVPSLEELGGAPEVVEDWRLVRFPGSEQIAAGVAIQIDGEWYPIGEGYADEADPLAEAVQRFLTFRTEDDHPLLESDGDREKGYLAQAHEIEGVDE